MKKKNAKDSLPNLKEGNIIKAVDDLLLHLIHCCHAPYHTELELCCPPVLLNEIELTVIFRVKFA